MKITKSTMMYNSLIECYLPADYSDVYACDINLENEIIPDNVMVYFLTNFPAWINALFKLRNFVVKFVGLKSSNGEDLKEFEKCIRTAKTYGFVSIPAKNNNETVLLLTDKHLNAYLSIRIESRGEKKTISVATLVHFKNKLGRIYFFVIRPFHCAIVRSMLKRTVNKMVHSTNV